MGLVSSARALDLEQEYILRRYTVDQGLPQNSVTRIAQTSDGYLWFATYRGLVRFDGVRFDVFDRSSSGLVSGQDSVDTMFLDSKGRLTVAFKGGQVVWVEGGTPEGVRGPAGFPDGAGRDPRRVPGRAPPLPPGPDRRLVPGATGWILPSGARVQGLRDPRGPHRPDSGP